MSSNQQYLLEYYQNLYNQTTRQIDLLHNSLDEIRHSINIISGVSGNRGRRQTRYRQSQQQQQQQQPRQSQQQQRQPTTNTSPLSTTAYFEYYVPTSATDSDINNLLSLFRNIERTPTPDPSLNNAGVLSTNTRTVPFSSITNPLNTFCPIEYEYFTPTTEVVQILGCNHIFTQSGITSWFMRDNRCPVCRYDIRTVTSAPTTTTTGSTTTEAATVAAEATTTPARVVAPRSPFPFSNILQ